MASGQKRTIIPGENNSGDKTETAIQETIKGFVANHIKEQVFDGFYEQCENTTEEYVDMLKAREYTWGMAVVGNVPRAICKKVCEIYMQKNVRFALQCNRLRFCSYRDKLIPKDCRLIWCTIYDTNGIAAIVPMVTNIEEMCHGEKAD